MWSDWLVVCDCSFSLSALWSPLSVPTMLLGFHLSWTWDLSSRLLQQSAAPAPYLGHGVASLGHRLWPLVGGSSSRPPPLKSSNIRVVLIFRELAVEGSSHKLLAQEAREMNGRAGQTSWTQGSTCPTTGGSLSAPSRGCHAGKWADWPSFQEKSESQYLQKISDFIC